MKIHWVRLDSVDAGEVWWGREVVDRWADNQPRFTVSDYRGDGSYKVHRHGGMGASYKRTSLGSFENLKEAKEACKV